MSRRALVMIFGVLQRAKIAWGRRLIPFWLSLWLLTSFGGPAAAWQHFDGTFCAPCTVSAPAVDDCCEEPQKQHAEIGLASLDDCRQCCAPTPRISPDKLVAASLQIAVLPARFTFAVPIGRETRLFCAFPPISLDAQPRPPPRGRAPPVWFSISPFCTPEI